MPHLGELDKTVVIYTIKHLFAFSAIKHTPNPEYAIVNLILSEYHFDLGKLYNYPMYCTGPIRETPKEQNINL